MGICSSMPGSNTLVNPAAAPTSALNARIVKALHIKRDENRGTKITFEKILLRFDRMRKVLRRVKVVFHEFEDKSKGGLNFEGLHKAMLKLHDNISRDEVVELFQFVDIDSSKVIELREFLVALTVGYVIDSIPTFKHLRRGSNVGPELNAQARTGSRSDMRSDMSSNPAGPLSEADELKNMLHYIVTAYLLFDTEGTGAIQKSSLERWFEEGGEKSRKNMELSEQLWQTMDWDANGMIDFAEFVHTFSDWVDIEEDGAELVERPGTPPPAV